MARIFSYFDDWENQDLSCRCGWCGPLRSDVVEHLEALMDFSCPQCGTTLAVVNYPTDAETLKNLDKIPDADRASVLRRQRFLAEADRLSLKRPAQLPELEGDKIELEWDFVTEGETHYTVIRQGTTVVWRELAFWEGYGRYKEVAKILKKKYRGRLQDLVPTERSYLYLLGDKLSAGGEVKKIRRRMRG